jgi:hypothetical protein
MIGAMTTTLLISLLLGLAAYGLFLAAFIHNDGYGRRDGYRHPPRSHHPDIFEPHSSV